METDVLLLLLLLLYYYYYYMWVPCTLYQEEFHITFLPWVQNRPIESVSSSIRYQVGCYLGKQLTIFFCHFFYFIHVCTFFSKNCSQWKSILEIYFVWTSLNSLSIPLSNHTSGGNKNCSILSIAMFFKSCLIVWNKPRLMMHTTPISKLFTKYDTYYCYVLSFVFCDLPYFK
jgi:hypothetical protein